MTKEIYVFVHVPKCFGTSFLNSIRNNNINNNSRIKNHTVFYDLFYDYYVQFKLGNKYSEVEFLEKEILPLFMQSRKRTLITHVHADTWNIDNVIPKEVFRKYIVTMRKPNARLRSAFFYRANERQNPNYIENGFFNSVVFRNGTNRMIPRIFGLEDDSCLDIMDLSKLYMIYLKDYVNRNDKLISLEKNMKINLYPVHSNASREICKLPHYSDGFFWNLMKHKLKKENEYYEYLVSRDINNMFLCY